MAFVFLGPKASSAVLSQVNPTQVQSTNNPCESWLPKFTVQQWTTTTKQNGGCWAPSLCGVGDKLVSTSLVSFCISISLPLSSVSSLCISLLCCALPCSHYMLVWKLLICFYKSSLIFYPISYFKKSFYSLHALSANLSLKLPPRCIDISASHAHCFVFQLSL